MSVCSEVTTVHKLPFLAGLFAGFVEETTAACRPCADLVRPVFTLRRKVAYSSHSVLAVICDSTPTCRQKRTCVHSLDRTQLHGNVSAKYLEVLV
jgi:hypothetical protein